MEEKITENNQIEKSIALPKDPVALSRSIKNIYVALNKATAKGTFDLKEAGQLCNDLDILAHMVEQINKLYNKEQTNNM